MRLSATANLTPQKNGNPNKFARTTPILKSVRNISDFTPLQQFQKVFSDLDKYFVKLRQTNPPDGLEQLFQDFSDFKTQYNIFVDSCNKISRHNKVGSNNNVTEKMISSSQTICKDFPHLSSEFFKYFLHIKSQLMQFFIQAFQNYFTIMETCFHQYGELCLREQQTRYYFLQYESTIQDLFSKCQNGLNHALSSFEELEDTSQVVESLKNLSRKFESELPQAILNQRIHLPQGNQILSHFHQSFVLIVPLLSKIPLINQLFDEITDLIDPFQVLLESLLNDLKIDAPHISTIHEIQDSITPNSLFHITPQDRLIQDISKLFGLGDGMDMSQEEWYSKILNKAQQTLNNYQQQIHQLTSQLKSYDQIKSEKVLNERIEENLKYKENVEKNFEERRAELMRNVINSVKVLVPYDLISTNDDFDTQLNCIISNAELEQKVTKENLNELKDTIVQTETILTDFLKSQLYVNPDRNMHLPNLAEFAVEKVKKQQRKFDNSHIIGSSPNSSDLNAFLKKFLTKNQIETNVSNLTTQQLKKELKKYVSNLKFKLNDTEDKLLKLKDYSSNYEDTTIKTLSTIQRSLAEMNNSEPLVSDVNFDSVSNSIMSLLETFSMNNQKQERFRHFLSSFLAQVLHALHMQQPKFKDMDDQQFKDVMSRILDSPQIQRNLNSGAQSMNATPRSTLKTLPINKKANDLTPSAISVRPSYRDNDHQFQLKVHSYLCDCCGQLRGVSSVQFIHNSVERLMQDVSRAIYDKNESLRNYQGLLADVCIRLEPNKFTKVELMKSDIATIATSIFTSIESLLSKDVRNIKENLSEMVNLIPMEDRHQFESMKLTPIDSVASELEKISKSHEIALSIIQLSDDLSNYLDKEKLGFVPVSQYFKNYMNSIENLRRISIRISEQETQSTIYLIITKLVALIDNYSIALSAVSMNDEISEKNKDIMNELTNQKELLKSIEQLKIIVDKKDHQMNQMKMQLRSFIQANREKMDNQIKILNDIHEKEINHIIQYYEKKQEF